MEKIDNHKHEDLKESRSKKLVDIPNQIKIHEIGYPPEYETGDKPPSEQPDIESSL